MKTKIAIVSILTALVMTTFAFPATGFAETNDTTTNPAVQVTVPAQVQGVKAEAYSCSKIKVSWTASKDCTGYEVLKKASDGKFKVIATIKSNKTTSHIDTVTPNKEYSYKVRAFNASGKATASETASAKAKVGTPAVVKAKATSCAIKVSWSKVKDATAYNVYRYNSSSKKYIRIKTTKGASYLNKKLTCSKKYAFKVVAYKSINGKKYYGTASKKVVARMVSRANYYNPTTVAGILNTAKSKLGCAYVWGASGPSAFDCSGYVYWTLKHTSANKVRPARSTATYMYHSKLKKYSIGRNRSKLKKGDIVMFGYNGTAKFEHTGIYYGNGKVIHASTPATGVTISNINYLQPVQAIVRLP